MENEGFLCRGREVFARISGMAEKKLKVAVLYGGKSGEHEISLRSAASVIRQLDRERFEVIPVGIDKEGRWHLNQLSLIDANPNALPLFSKVASESPLVALPPTAPSGGPALIPFGNPAQAQAIDVVFPVMHGPLCEDGTLQGLLELANVAYVGCGVLSSAVSMDKEVAKRLIRDAGLPIVPYVSAKQASYLKNSKALEARVTQELGYPCFVKPANLGSSVGVHKVKDAAQLHVALKDAFRFDGKVLIEKAIDAREIEIAALENPDSSLPCLVSTVGEIVPKHEFYSYEAKYLDENGASLLIPANLNPAQMAEAQRVAREAFSALECEGMARVDLFLDRGTGKFYFNEVNTIPGFTSISMYPKLWEATGIAYPALLSKLIDLALARHQRQKKLTREFHAN